ncbi:hypothetical protein [Streptomyces ureilyticus]|uniref:Uncharacterized protein n=1 Tax=Streptomyces ureilyticus TaxID=1775131 RepID=A0ABX0DV51_9ACTN|nr:hypothetical protein [Streptomyces ureilyticus]NGO44349.1 hypothetical protein [Streptomyces ureilyticus]
MIKGAEPARGVLGRRRFVGALAAVAVTGPAGCGTQDTQDRPEAGTASTPARAASTGSAGVRRRWAVGAVWVGRVLGTPSSSR